MGWFSRKKKDAGLVESVEAQVDERGAGESDDPLIDRNKMKNDRYLNLAVAKFNSEMRFWMLFALTAVSVAANCYNSLQSKYIPVIVAVDGFGQKLMVGPVSESKPADLQRVIYRELADFAEASRGVSADMNYQKGMLRHLGTRIRAGTQAAQMIAELHKLRPPYETGKFNTITVENVTPLKLTDATYSVEWKEVRRTINGDVLSEEKWKANLTIKLEPRDDRDSVISNPIGFFVENIDWSKVR